MADDTDNFSLVDGEINIFQRPEFFFGADAGHGLSFFYQKLQRRSQNIRQNIPQGNIFSLLVGDIVFFPDIFCFDYWRRHKSLTHPGSAAEPPLLIEGD